MQSKYKRTVARQASVLGSLGIAAITLLGTACTTGYFGSSTSDSVYHTTLVARPDGTPDVEDGADTQNPLTLLTPSVNPTANISVVSGRTPVAPRTLFKRPTGHSFATNCFVDFSDHDALARLTYAPEGYSPFAENTFTWTPWWFQSCKVGTLSAVVRPIDVSHFHLGYERQDIGQCDGDLADFDIIHEDGSCEEFDPRDEPRSLHPHEGRFTTHIYVFDGNFNGEGKWPFKLRSIKVENDQAIRLCYKPLQDIEGPWITNHADGTTSPGVWYCWDRLTRGHWDLSDRMDWITEVKIKASSGNGIYQIDDIQIDVF